MVAVNEKQRGQGFIFDRIWNNSFAEPQNAQDAKQRAPVIFMLYLLNQYRKIEKAIYKMKNINDLDLGFNDAENYRKRENKSLFNQIFVRNYFLDEILHPSKYFLIGEKGTGKTAYSVFLSNNYYKENISELKYIRETDYKKFVTLKAKKHLELSDYTNIWIVIILLLLSKSINKEELDHFPFNKTSKLKALLQAIDEYYLHAFSPEIISVLNFIENSKLAAELITKHLKIGGEETISTSFSESRFQINLTDL